MPTHFDSLITATDYLDEIDLIVSTDALSNEDKIAKIDALIAEYVAEHR